MTRIVIVALAALGLSSVGLPGASTLPASDAARPSLRDVHTELESSVPADGDTLRVMPQRIRLRFNQGVDAALGSVRIVGSDGREWRTEPATDSADARIVHADAPRLPAGTYRLHWRVVSGDGHPVEGDFAFHIEEGDAPGPAASPEADTARAPGAPDAAGPGASQEAGPRTGAAGRTFPSLLRGIAVGLSLALAGWLAFHAWVVPGSGRRIGLALAGTATLALGAHFIAWVAYIAPGSLDVDVVRAAVGTASGRGEAARLGLTALAALLVGFRRAHAAAVVALLAAAAGGAVGHAVGTGAPLPVVVKAIHLVAVAGWLGGLLTLVAGRHDPGTFPHVARSVSRAALACVVIVAGTGAWQALDLLPSFGALVGSTYGRLVLLKVAGLGVLVAFGARHRFRLIPALPEDGSGRLRRSVASETAVLVVVLLVAGFLAYVPPPEPSAALSALP